MFDGVFGHGAITAETGDAAWLRALLDAEAALARACARAGVIDPAHAEAIGRACSPDNFDPAALGRAATAGGNPVIPLVEELTRLVGGDAARHVHQGATSQDILDTALMLLARRALAVVLADLRDAGDRLAELASAHRATAMAGRTLLQQALPTTFGAVAANWLGGLDSAAARLDDVAAHRLAAQLGGAAGTLASLGERGPEVVAAFAAELGLAEPALPWHTERGRIAELAGALAQACGAVGKTAGDIVLLAQTEVGEVVEEGPPGSGGSSTLPHKRNPVAAVSALACARQAPGLAATLFAAQVQEHQRAAGAWHAEWPAAADLLGVTGSAAAWLRTSLGRLRVVPERMRRNLEATGGLLLAERVTADLTAELGRMDAHALVQRACARSVAERRSLADVVTEELAGRRTRARIDALLDPEDYLGEAPRLADRAAAAHRALRRGAR
ncbi:3-carboxy-cis,cis-muconate cycloisomerase [Thermobifida halotolerans]|uniref:3-carboxy-cis,cis-muconate cycloisomerase n=1 Tax=Thermobifida halotolerans TaxID=483545 RepID=A0A399G632_9ACTN|nr:3-carboxy-cis,cis-muconate cycloisomerase [Thermobifida halotolerans]UOE21795.1 3-carboxy-cis,cis-muconate cycloisomerase [Thermobifida halotolerans]